MPEYRRARAPGATFFFTVNTHLRQPFLIDADVRAALRESVERVRATMPFQIDAWVIARSPSLFVDVAGRRWRFFDALADYKDGRYTAMWAETEST